MSDVTINYRSGAIATMDSTGTVLLGTSGKYCDSDIEVAYVKPAGGNAWTVANATRDTSYQGAIFTAPSGCTAVPTAYILYTTAAISSVSGSPIIAILKDSTHNLMWYYESGSVKVKTVTSGDFSVWYQDGKIYFDDDNTYGLASNTTVGLICVYGQAGTVSFRTKTHTPASNSTTATFATEEEPAMFVCGLDATVSLSSTHKVQTVVYSDDVNVFSGTNFYTSNIGYYTNFTESYSSSTLTLTSYSSGTSGYFNSGSQYTLYYLLSGDLSSSTNLGEKTITTNGTYNASTDGYDGYSKVVANVPNTYTNADEGKVVSNGALVAQTSDSVTQNGTVDTTLIDSLTVNVPASAVDSGTKNITENGNNQDVVGYASVNVSVPNSYESGDEGKVVSSGALVSQTAHADVTPTTSDQTINTTTNNSIKVKGDADLVAGNIKKDVEIFGVTGSYEGSGGGNIGGLANLVDISDPELEIPYMLSAIKNGNTVGGTFTIATNFPNNSETLLISTGLPVVHGFMLIATGLSIIDSLGTGQSNKHGVFFGRDFTNYPNNNLSSIGYGMQNGDPRGASYNQNFGTRADAYCVHGILRIDNGDIYYTGRYNMNASYQIVLPNYQYEWLAW